MTDITRWLEQHGLGKYAGVFAENEIEWEVLPRLDDDDLREMGLPIGPRKKFQAAIEALSNEPQPSTGSLVQQGEAERRQLTVMFCDLVGSTALSEGMDPEEFREIVTAFQSAATGVIEKFEGYVARYMGDGLLVYFGYPVAHEDDAELAARAGLALVERLARRPLVDDVEVAVRIGISTGMVVVGDLVGEGSSEERAVLGDTPNLAARLQGAASPNTALISASTRRLIEGRFQLAALGPLELKGFAAPTPAWQLVSEEVADSRFEARHRGQLPQIIGREQELALLTECWRQAIGGEGQMVVLTGEAGIGKSRITRALIDSLADEPHTRISYQCSPYQSDSALHPVTEHLLRATDFSVGDALGVKLEKLESLIGMGTADVDSVAPLFAALLGLDGAKRYGALNMTPQQQRRRTLEALSDQPPGLSAHAPVLLVVEDVHWIDPTTLELIELVLNKIENARVLVLATARPTFQYSFGGHPIVTRLALNRFGRSQTLAMVERLSAGNALPGELVEEIVKRTDGVPLFVEELTKTVLESDLLRLTEDGYVLEGALTSVTIPTSLHDSLMARLDRLQPVKEVAQTAACIGRDFDYRMLSAISPLPDPELANALAHLVEAELVFCRGEPPEATYTFKHALVRDAAYDSLLRSMRQQVHARIFAALEEAAAQSAEIIAYHATEAGFTDQAVIYWQRAGVDALARSANQEAVGHFHSAVRIVQSMGDEQRWTEKELALQVLLGQALIATRGYAAPETMEAFERGIRLADAIGDTRFRIPALFGQWSGEYIRVGATRELVDDFAAVAANGQESGPRVIALRMRTLEKLHAGKFLAALELVENSLESYVATEHRALALEYGHDPRAAALNYKCWLKWFLGYPDQSDEAGREALQWAQEIDHDNTQGIVLCWSYVLSNVLQRRLEETVDSARYTIEFADERVMPLWRAWSRIFLGWAMVQLQGNADGLADIDAGLLELKEVGARRFLPWTLALQAEAHSYLERHEVALEIMESSFEAFHDTYDFSFESELYRIRGDIRVRNRVADCKAAQSDFREAISVAQRQHARSFELRATLSLAHCLKRSGEERDIHSLLSSMFNQFTEGFQSPDLRAAKALLDGLS